MVYLANNADTISDEAEVVYLTNITSAVDSEGNNVEKIYVLKDGVEKTFTTRYKNGLSLLEGLDISIGDGVRYRLNDKNEITLIEKAFDVSQNAVYYAGTRAAKKYTFDTRSEYYTGLFLGYGVVRKKAGKVINVEIDGYNDDKNFSIPLHTNFKLDNAKIYIYDSSKPSNRCLSVGTIDDIVDSEHSSRPTRLFIYNSYGMAKSVLVMK